MMVLSRAPLQLALIGSADDNLSLAIHEHVYGISQQAGHVVDVFKPWMSDLSGMGFHNATKLNKAIIDATHESQRVDLRQIAGPAAIFGGVWSSIGGYQSNIPNKTLTHYLMAFRTGIDTIPPLYIAGRHCNEQESHALARTVESAKNAIFDNDWARFGKMVEQGLKIEAKMGRVQFSEDANSLLIKARLAGALGGTFNHDVMVLIVPPASQESVSNAIGDEHHRIDCRVEYEGARLVYSV